MVPAQPTGKQVIEAGVCSESDGQVSASASGFWENSAFEFLVGLKKEDLHSYFLSQAGGLRSD